MQLTRGEIYIPDGLSPIEGLKRTTHLAVVAHPDDAEIMAYPGIEACHADPAAWFTAVIATDGRGGPRHGRYAGLSDAEMIAVRTAEQKEAARRGRYGALVLLGHPSTSVRDPINRDLTRDLKAILDLVHPRIVYTHNPADRHDTHVAVFLRTITALREIASRPDKVYGCEVWRSLDWLTGPDRIRLDASADPRLAADLIAAHASQLAGGKRFDLATLGRRQANAVFEDASQGDPSEAVVYAMDLTPLVSSPDLDVQAFVDGCLARFRGDVLRRLEQLG